MILFKVKNKVPIKGISSDLNGRLNDVRIVSLKEVVERIDDH